MDCSINLPAYPIAASRITPGRKLKRRDETLVDGGCSITTAVLIRFPHTDEVELPRNLRKDVQTDQQRQQKRETDCPSVK
jgi:hypothetical protein